MAETVGAIADAPCDGGSHRGRECERHGDGVGAATAGPGEEAGQQPRVEDDDERERDDDHDRGEDEHLNVAVEVPEEPVVQAARHEPVRGHHHSHQSPRRTVGSAEVAGNRGGAERQQGDAEGEREEHFAGLAHLHEEQAGDDAHWREDHRPGDAEALAQDEPQADRRQQQGGHAEGDPEPARLAAASTLSGLRQAADRGNNVDVARLQRGEGHREERDHHAQRVADDDGLERDVRANQREAVAAGDLQQPDGHAQRAEDTQRGAADPGEQRVRQALGDERLDEMAALSADGPSHTHLFAALGSEHHEDHEDKHDAGDHREQAKDEEQGREDAALQFRRVDAVLLELDDLDGADVAVLGEQARAFSIDEAIQRSAGSRRVLEAGADVALERGANGADLALVARQLLEPVEAHGDAAGDAGEAQPQHTAGHLIADDARDVDVVRLVADVDRQGVAELRVQLAGGLLADEHVVGPERREVDGAAAGVGEATELRLARRGRTRPLR